MNRFGGGNTSKIGLKEDGKTLLEYLHEKKIAIDFSHASDQLVDDIINFIIQKNLQIPIMASHSNFRQVFNHARNLPNEIAKEIINRKGLIGINFLRAFLNNDDPNAMYDHIQHGLELGGESNVCFGADYFYTQSHPDQSRQPFFFKDHKNASTYPSILKKISDTFSHKMAENMSHQNVIRFFNQLTSN